MGNWRTITITGTVPAEQVKPLRDALLYDYRSDTPNEDAYGPLAFSPTGSLCGIHEWVAENVSAGGNCFERDFEVEDIAEHLRRLLRAAPGMALKVHCGDDYEDEKCIATITAANGEVTVGDPEVSTVHGVVDAGARMLGLLWGR